MMYSGLYQHTRVVLYIYNEVFFYFHFFLQVGVDSVEGETEEGEGEEY